MSSDRPASRTSVLRDVTIERLPDLDDLDAITGASRAAVDPVAFEAARAEAYEHGWAAGRRDGYDVGRREALEEAAGHEAERAARFDRALSALAHAAAELSARRADHTAELEDALVDGALELATAMLGRELELATSPGRDALSRALRLADGIEPALVRMHPDDIATLGDPAALAPGRDLVVVADPSVERSGCVVEIGEGSIDARLGAALARVHQELGR